MQIYKDTDEYKERKTDVLEEEGKQLALKIYALKPDTEDEKVWLQQIHGGHLIGFSYMDDPEHGFFALIPLAKEAIKDAAFRGYGYVRGKVDGELGDTEGVEAMPDGGWAMYLRGKASKMKQSGDPKLKQGAMAMEIGADAILCEGPFYIDIVQAMKLMEKEEYKEATVVCTEIVDTYPEGAIEIILANALLLEMD